MPKQNLTDEIELHGRRYRLRRTTGFAAGEALWCWGGVVGTRGAHVLALGPEKLAKVARERMTEEQRAAFASLGELDEHRALAMLGVVQVMERGQMSPATLRTLAEYFVFRWVDIASSEGWHEIDSFEALDKRLDGVNDAQLWNDLVWRQVAHCLGPTIGVSGTPSDTEPMASTPAS